MGEDSHIIRDSIQKIAFHGAHPLFMSWFPALPPSQRRAFALSALASAVASAVHAQTAPPAPQVNEQELPVTVRAEEISGRPDRELNLTRDVEITRGQTRMTANSACYRMVEDEITAEGNVNLERFGDRY
ncbi:MAG TPA: hypothetical protein VF861_12745, partial [Telluria sp.]